MDFSVQELAAFVGGQFAAGPSVEARVHRASSIPEAGEGDVTFYTNPRYLPALKTCRATAVLVPDNFTEPVPPVAIRVADPARAFAELLERFAPPPVAYPPGIHPTAVLANDAEIAEGASIQPHVVIEAGARIGARTVIGAGSYIGHGVHIGADCHLGPRVTVAARCLLGDRVNLHSGVVIGGDGFGFELAADRHVKIPQTGIVQIDDDVEVGANTTIDRARFGRTWIGAGTKIDNLVQIAHNVVLGRHCIICAHVGISGSARLGNHVVLGGQVGMVGHIELGDGVQVGAQSGVGKSAPPKTVLLGTPAAPIHEMKQQYARVARLEKLVQRVRRLEEAIKTERSTPPAL